MKASRLTTLLGAACFTACLTPVAVATPPTYKMTTDIPQSFTVPDRVETSIGKFEFFDGVPTRDTVEPVYD